MNADFNCKDIRFFLSILAYSGITEEEETLVSLCQVHTQLDESHGFDDRTLLSLLAALKMHDFKIGQPVWGPSNTLMYLCEYRLKSGPKLTAIEQELKTVIKNNGASSKNLGWSCA